MERTDNDDKGKRGRAIREERCDGERWGRERREKREIRG